MCAGQHYLAGDYATLLKRSCWDMKPRGGQNSTDTPGHREKGWQYGI